MGKSKFYVFSTIGVNCAEAEAKMNDFLDQSPGYTVISFSTSVYFDMYELCMKFMYSVCIEGPLIKP